MSRQETVLLGCTIGGSSTSTVADGEETGKKGNIKTWKMLPQYLKCGIHSPYLSASWHVCGKMHSVGGAINTDACLPIMGMLWLLQTCFSFFAFLLFFSLFSDYTAVTYWWARNPEGQTGASPLDIDLESSITRTKDMFEFIHSNNRASKKWVTLPKTFRFV